MEFVLVSLISLGVLFLVLLLLICIILYKKHGRKLTMTYVDESNDGKTILDDAHEIVDNYEKAVEDRKRVYG